MKIEKFTVSNDPAVYEAWPDVALTASGKMLCVFSECIHHRDRSYTRLMLSESGDRGRTWTPKRPLTEGTAGRAYYYNCARISVLPDGVMAVIVDRVPYPHGEESDAAAVNCLYLSRDEGRTWTGPRELPLRGIVPDKLIVLDTGRRLIAAHRRYRGKLTQFLRYSDDGGESWSEDITVAHDPRFHLCEVSMLPLGHGTIVAFLRENSFLGYDCKKVISLDHGESWGPVLDFPLPGCHRPVAGLLATGSVFITYRFVQGGIGLADAAQNFFGALTDRESALAKSRHEARTRIIPLDYDAAEKADLGYSGWVEFDDGEIYVVSYIVDDAADKGQIRGYALNRRDPVRR